MSDHRDATIARLSERNRQLETENAQLRARLVEVAREKLQWKAEAEKRGAVGWNDHG